MHSPERSAPDIVAGRRVRRVDVTIAELPLFVLEAADADAVLDETLSDDGDPYAAILWPSALAAAGRLADIARPGQRVVDLGAGTGLVSFTAARLGCAAIALDHDPFARAVITEAARLQRLAVEVRDFDVAAETPLPPGDVVVLADLLYEPELARAAALRVREAVRRGARAIVGDPARYARAPFVKALERENIPVVFEDVVVRVPGEARPGRVGLAVIEP